MPYIRKDGQVNYPKHMVIDEYTFRTDLSRQRKYQLRRRKRGCCVTCGVAQLPRDDGTFPEKCEGCRINTRANRAGLLQGRAERDSSVGEDVEGFVD